MTILDSEIDKLLLEAIMSTVANDLALNVSWGSQKNAVFKALFQDFMKNVTAVSAYISIILILASLTHYFDLK